MGCEGHQRWKVARWIQHGERMLCHLDLPLAVGLLKAYNHWQLESHSHDAIIKSGGTRNQLG